MGPASKTHSALPDQRARWPPACVSPGQTTSFWKPPNLSVDASIFQDRWWGVLEVARDQMCLFVARTGEHPAGNLAPPGSTTPRWVVGGLCPRGLQPVGRKGERRKEAKSSEKCSKCLRGGARRPQARGLLGRGVWSGCLERVLLLLSETHGLRLDTPCRTCQGSAVRCPRRDKGPEGRPRRPWLKSPLTWEPGGGGGGDTIHV